MKYNFYLKGLDCANCAAKIESKLNKSDKFNEVIINFSLLKLIVDCDPLTEAELTDSLQQAVNAIEHGVTVIPWDEQKGLSTKHSQHSHEHDHCQDCSCDSETSHSSGHMSDIIKNLIIPLSGLIIGLFAIIFMPDSTVKWILFGTGYVLLSYRILYLCGFNILHGQIFDENLLMSIAAIGAIVSSEYTEALAVMFLYQVGEFLQDLATKRSRKSITGAMNLKAETANLKTPDGIKVIPSQDVIINDILIIKPGEKIPVDGIVTEGSSFIDTSSLTGESVPRHVNSGDHILSGCINGDSPLTITASTSYENSTVAKIIDLVENATSRKSNTENFITRFSKVYTPIVVFAALIFAILPPILTGSLEFTPWIYKACGFLVVSCPCALIISVPLGFFSGLGYASKNGIIIKGSNYLDALSRVDTVVFDKTGTLTEGVFKVCDIAPADGVDKLSLLSIAARIESISTHPIAKSVVSEYEEISGKKLTPADSSESFQEISGRGIAAHLMTNGKVTEFFLGNKALMDEHTLPFAKYKTDQSGTIVYIATKDRYYGCIRIADKIKKDSPTAISKLRNKGFNVVMLTGDRHKNAYFTAKELGIDNLYSELLPDEKVKRIEEIIDTSSGKVMFVGDGINDAPVLALADLGVAMGGVGSDAAIEAADIVLMNDEPSGVNKAVNIAKYTHRIVMENIIFSLGVKLIIMVLVSTGISNLWLAVFADVGVALIAILNSLRIFSGVKDR